jgi:hypothetical protein
MRADRHVWVIQPGSRAVFRLLFGPNWQLFIVASAGGAPGNYDFRVYFVGSPVICNGQPWAYININDTNYAAIVANALAARTSGAMVSLNWTQQSNGYCQINFMTW